MLTGRNFVSLSIVVTGDEPPSEFCIFTAGKVETTKGTFTFDEAAAISVMQEYEAHGIDLMIDYDHASLAPLAVDPAQAGKAAGWFNLEVRNGELWAVNVRWTPPAAEALKRKEWRFMSPAFGTNEGHITDLMNVAITNLPATRRLEPLMAASDKGGPMTLEEFAKVCKALGLESSMSIEDALAKIKGEEPAAEEPAAEEPPAEEPAPVPAAMAEKPEDDEEKPAEVAAALSKIMRLSGKSTFVASVAEIEVWHASHLKLEHETQKLAAERATLEAAERRKGCVDLVVLAGRAPAEVWADDKSSAPKSYLANMPMADFRDYVASAVKAKGNKPAPAAKPPVTASAAEGGKIFMIDGKPVEVSARELQICADSKCDPAVFASLKARRATTA